MSALPPPPPTWRRISMLPRALGRELRWHAEMRVRRWRVRLRGGTLPRTPQTLRRAWSRTDPHAMRRVFERLHSMPASPPPPRPSIGAQARYRGLLTAGWRGDLRIGDADLDEWLATELGGWIGQEGVRVELSVRVLAGTSEDSDMDAAAPPRRVARRRDGSRAGPRGRGAGTRRDPRDHRR